MRRLAGLLVAGGVVGGLLAGCGVDVPDDVAAEIRSSTTTEAGAPATTAVPRSDDELEQALIDNGYSLEEAECGAANLREQLGEDEVRSIVEADTIEDIGPSTARGFADALRPCVEDGASADPSDDPAPPPDGGEQMPGFGDDSEGDVSRARFLAALISGGIPDEQARCIVAGVFAELDQEEINLLFHAESESDVPAAILDTFTAITDGCE